MKLNLLSNGGGIRFVRNSYLKMRFLKRAGDCGVGAEPVDIDRQAVGLALYGRPERTWALMNGETGWHGQMHHRPRLMA